MLVRPRSLSFDGHVQGGPKRQLTDRLFTSLQRLNNNLHDFLTLKHQWPKIVVFIYFLLQRHHCDDAVYVLTCLNGQWSSFIM